MYYEGKDIFWWLTSNWLLNEKVRFLNHKQNEARLTSNMKATILDFNQALGIIKLANHLMLFMKISKPQLQMTQENLLLITLANEHEEYTFTCGYGAGSL